MEHDLELIIALLEILEIEVSQHSPESWKYWKTDIPYFLISWKYWKSSFF